MDFIFKKSQEKSKYLFFDYSKKAFFEKPFKINFLVLYFLSLTLAYPLENKKIPNEIISEDSFNSDVPQIISAKMVSPGVLEIQFKAPLESKLLKYEYAVDGAPFWTSVENISSPFPVNGANGIITIASFPGKSSIRIRAIGSNLVYVSEPFYLTNSPTAAPTVTIQRW